MTECFHKDVKDVILRPSSVQALLEASERAAVLLLKVWCPGRGHRLASAWFRPRELVQQGEELLFGFPPRRVAWLEPLARAEALAARVLQHSADRSLLRSQRVSVGH